MALSTTATGLVLASVLRVARQLVNRKAASQIVETVFITWLL